MPEWVKSVAEILVGMAGIMIAIGTILAFIKKPFPYVKHFFKEQEALKKVINNLLMEQIINFYVDLKNGEAKSALQYKLIFDTIEEYLGKGGNGEIARCAEHIKEERKKCEL